MVETRERVVGAKTCWWEGSFQLLFEETERGAEHTGRGGLASRACGMVYIALAHDIIHTLNYAAGVHRAARELRWILWSKEAHCDRMIATGISKHERGGESVGEVRNQRSLSWNGKSSCQLRSWANTSIYVPLITCLDI